MQIKIVTIPIGDSGLAQEELNRFLRGHKVLEVENKLISNENGAYWCFCIKYIESQMQTISLERKEKVDYRQVLDTETFAKFAKLREIRKKVAEEQAVPAYAIFTDEELSHLAKLEEITEKTMQSIKGIGEKKAEKYGKYFIKITEN